MKKYEKFFISATKPLSGKYQYNDQFFLYPVDAKYNNELQNLLFYDIALEISTEGKEPYLRYSNQFEATDLGKQVTEIVHLLSVVTQFQIFEPCGPVEDSLLGFSKINCGDVKKGEIKFYQNKLLNSRSINEIIFPARIDELFDSYFSLDSNNRDIIRKSIYLFNEGVELEAEHKSLSFVSLVSSIETLIAASLKGTNKVTKKFKWFIKHFCGEIDDEYLNKLYDTRCRIVHDGYILLGDIRWDNNYNKLLGGNHDDYFIRKNLINISRSCLLNWMVFVAENNNILSLDDLFNQ